MKGEKIIREYDKPDAFIYGLKIVSPFEDEFRLVVKKGAEVIEVEPGVKETIENNMSKSRLLIIHVHEGAEFEYVESARGDAAAKCDTHIFLLGVGARAKIIARYDLDGEAKLDVLHKIHHQAPNTASEIEARGVLRGKAHAIYRSDIVMEKGMEGLSGAETAKFLVLSKDASADAVPSLDIKSKEVSCSHSLSITHLPPEDLFYAKTRGMGEGEARELLIDGFLRK